MYDLLKNQCTYSVRHAITCLDIFVSVFMVFCILSRCFGFMFIYMVVGVLYLIMVCFNSDLCRSLDIGYAPEAYQPGVNAFFL